MKPSKEFGAYAGLKRIREAEAILPPSHSVLEFEQRLWRKESATETDRKERMDAKHERNEPAKTVRAKREAIRASKTNKVGSDTKEPTANTSVSTDGPRDVRSLRELKRLNSARPRN